MPQVQPQGSPLPSRCVLIVDDDVRVVSAVRHALNFQQSLVVSATDNQEALKLVQEHPFDLIITGSKTPAQEDVRLLQQIRRIRPHTRLIILTDEGTPADVIAVMREGAFSYFSKSFSMDSLAEIVRLATLGPAWDDGIEIVSATPEWVSIIARCDSDTAERLVQFFQEMSDLPRPERDDVATAFREMLLNAIEHGGNFDPNQYVEVAYVRTRKAVMCRVKDPGQGFSLEEIHHCAVNNPAYDPLRHAVFREAQGLRPGGYGVLMAKHLVDELMYSEKGNEVLLIKYLSFAAAETTIESAKLPPQ